MNIYTKCLNCDEILDSSEIQWGLDNMTREIDWRCNNCIQLRYNDYLGE